MLWLKFEEGSVREPTREVEEGNKRAWSVRRSCMLEPSTSWVLTPDHRGWPTAGTVCTNNLTVTLKVFVSHYYEGILPSNS